MKNTKKIMISLLVAGLSIGANASDHAKKQDSNVSIDTQRSHLEVNTNGKGFGPQSPRDIDSTSGANEIYFSMSPKSKMMNLCNIHFHRGAEHKGGEFSTYIGDGDGHGYGSGYKYSGTLSQDELKNVDKEICPSKHGSLKPGDTIEVHYVYSTDKVGSGATLGACLNESTFNPQLRVEAQVYVLVNDEKAADFKYLTAHEKVNGKNQAINIPTDTGKGVEYLGSTTGPKYNEKASPFKVTWSVRPKIKKVNIRTVGKWCESNVFKEDHAHAVRNLVINPKLLSVIE